MDPHRVAEQTSIALHRAVAERLRDDPEAVGRAITRVREWLTEGGAHPHYARRWLALLERPLDELCAALVTDTEDMRALRQVSPFAGELDPRTRWRIWRRVRAEHRESA